MTADIDVASLLKEMRDGLEGVTSGPWWPGHLADENSTCDCASILAENGKMGSIAQVTIDNGLRIGDGGNDGPPIEEAKRNLAHIARCSPDNIRALLDEVEQSTDFAEWSLIENNVVVNKVWDLIGGPDPTREGGQNLLVRVKEALAKAGADAIAEWIKT